MRAAIAQSGADGALLVQLSGFKTETTDGDSSGVVAPVGPDMYVGWYEPGIVSTNYQAATIYTTLFDVRTAKPVWTFNPATYNPATCSRTHRAMPTTSRVCFAAAGCSPDRDALLLALVQDRADVVDRRVAAGSRGRHHLCARRT